MSMYDLSAIKPGDKVEFFAAALPDPNDRVRYAPCVTVVVNGEHITMHGAGGMSYLDAFNAATRMAENLTAKQMGIAHAR